jgi:hypothetical protein
MSYMKDEININISAVPESGARLAEGRLTVSRNRKSRANWTTADRCHAASITMTDKRTGAIVYAYAVDKKSTMHGQQTTAEACAKHLKISYGRSRLKFERWPCLACK